MQDFYHQHCVCVCVCQSLCVCVRIGCLFGPWTYSYQFEIPFLSARRGGEEQLHFVAGVRAGIAMCRPALEEALQAAQGSRREGMKVRDVHVCSQQGSASKGYWVQCSLNT